MNDNSGALHASIMYQLRPQRVYLNTIFLLFLPLRCALTGQVPSRHQETYY